tara:strand:- start:251 stop:388 length:138 start_codon:yes stop_codon:yes gene_type:complete
MKASSVPGVGVLERQNMEKKNNIRIITNNALLRLLKDVFLKYKLL